MNTRLVVTSKAWFGGGADLTPVLDRRRSQDDPDSQAFHAAMRAACDAHAGVAPYDKYKKWCDDYFFLKHRNEMRGIGGIFYDYLETDWEATFAFTQDVGRAFLRIYPELVAEFATPWSEAEREGQLVRRGPRRVQFALRPRHHLWPAHRRQCRIDPVLDATGGEVAMTFFLFPRSGMRVQCQRPVNQKCAAQQHHRVEDRGVHMNRHALDERLGEERARQRHDAYQQCESGHLRRDHAGEPEHRNLHDADHDRDRRIGGDHARPFHARRHQQREQDHARPRRAADHDAVAERSRASPPSPTRKSRFFSCRRSGTLTISIAPITSAAPAPESRV